jgi:hypothetical protein
MYIGAPGANRVYAYGRVDVPTQSVSCTGDGSTAQFNYSDTIIINPAHPSQLLVTVNNSPQIYGTDYTISSTNILFASAPVAGDTVTILRPTSIQLDANYTVFDLQPYLYTAINYDSFTVMVNEVLQRPYIDYTFSGTTLTFITVPATDALIQVQSAATGQAYWQYISTISVAGINNDAGFGISITTDQLGVQVLIGAPAADATNAAGDTVVNAGAVYAFDRSVVRYIIDNASQLSYDIPGAHTAPVAVILNNQYLTNTAQYANGQFTVI